MIGSGVCMALPINRGSMGNARCWKWVREPTFKRRSGDNGAGLSTQVLGSPPWVLDLSPWGFGLVHRVVNAKDMVGGLWCDAFPALGWGGGGGGVRGELWGRGVRSW